MAVLYFKLQQSFKDSIIFLKQAKQMFAWVKEGKWESHISDALALLSVLTKTDSQKGTL